MNLGKRRITNDDLCACFEQIGCTDAWAFLASGNVAFDAPGSASAVARRVEQGLAEQLGYDVPTFLRSAARVRALAEAQPFAGRAIEPRGKLQVVFLQKKPTRGGAAGVAKLDCDDDWLELDGSELFWWPRGGVSQSELDFAALERLVGPTTVRTHRTVQRLAAKLAG